MYNTHKNRTISGIGLNSDYLPRLPWREGQEDHQAVMNQILKTIRYTKLADTLLNEK